MRFIDYYQPLLESKQSVINLGFPPIIAKLFYDKLGEKSYTIARWFKEYHTYTESAAKDPKWWYHITHSFRRSDPDIAEYVKAYTACDNLNKEQFIKILNHLDIDIDPDKVTDEYMTEEKYQYLYEIKELIWQNVFFKNTLIRDILRGHVTDVNQYKDLSFKDATEKYNRKKIFQDKEPALTFADGYRWIDAGDKCELVAGLMKNCGSTGVMGTDSDRTMYVLFDKHDKGHIIITYSPNQHKLSEPQGVAVTKPKEKYFPYIFSLADHLKAYIRADTKSTLLNVNIVLRGKVKSITELSDPEEDYNLMMHIVGKSGKQYYTNGYTAITPQTIAMIPPEDAGIKKADTKVEKLIKYLRYAIQYGNRNAPEWDMHKIEELAQQDQL